MKTILKTGMYTTLGLAAHTFVRANEVIESSKKSLKEREFDGQIIYGILKGKSLEYVTKRSNKFRLDAKWDQDLAVLNGIEFSLNDLGELWEA